MSELDRRQLRSAFGAFPTGVTVVTASDSTGVPVGFTANSFTSVSMEPPLLLVCPSKNLGMFSVFENAPYFAVNILSEGQEQVSNTFAGFKGDRFAQVDWHTDAHGCPLIGGAAVHLSCRSYQRVDAGDHLVMIGEIVEFSHHGDAGLGYSNGGYFNLGLERQVEAKASAALHNRAGALVERDGELLLQQTSDGWKPPEIEMASRNGIRSGVEAHFEQIGFPIELGPVYSLFDDIQAGKSYSYFRAAPKQQGDSPAGRFVPIEQIDELKIASPAHRSMLKRYAYEYQVRNFALYIGDAEDGEIHQL